MERIGGWMYMSWNNNGTMLTWELYISCGRACFSGRADNVMIITIMMFCHEYSTWLASVSFNVCKLGHFAMISHPEMVVTAVF